MRNGLAVERMTVPQLFRKAFALIRDVSPLSPLTFHERDAAVGQLYAVLDEIQLRGDQLQLSTPPAPSPPDEAS